ncbi:TetR/AcrR family transcriptional regulator [Micromonospora chokoriensis]
MREIARQAGVGPATLYRRFPTKQALATEAFAEQMDACRVIVDEGLADPDPGGRLPPVRRARHPGVSRLIDAGPPGGVTATPALSSATRVQRLSGRSDELQAPVASSSMRRWSAR